MAVDGPGTSAVLTWPRAPALGRAAAVLAVVSAAVHLTLLDATSLGSLLMVAMAAVCLPCAWHLWRSPTASVWAMTAAVDGVMLVVHAQMLGRPAHEMAGMHSAGAPSPLMWLGLALVVGQLALAGTAALRRRVPGRCVRTGAPGRSGRRTPRLPSGRVEQPLHR